MKLRKKCEVCDKPIESIIKLDNYPITEGLTKEYINQKNLKFNQEFQYCTKCNHGQLSNVLDKEYLYGDKYSFRTRDSCSRDSNLRLKDKIIDISKRYNIKKIVDIGCNDGYLLKTFKDNFDVLIGIDPILKRDEVEDNLILIKGYAEDLNISMKNSIVITHQVLEHLEHPKDFIKKIIKRANNNTIFLFSFPSLDCLVKNKRFDNIFHHHLNYFSHNSICKLLENAGCEILNVDWNKKYWGSIVITFKKGFGNRVKKYKKLDKQYILNQYHKFKENMDNANLFFKNYDNVYCYGATYQFPILDYYIPDIKKSIGIIDDSIYKKGLYPLGVNLKIIHNKDIEMDKGFNVFITAINFSRDIIVNLINKSVNKIYVLFNEI
jgi:cyclopropane-fatty-acyl-phospholipid synthase